jgi:hypothetical protein
LSLINLCCVHRTRHRSHRPRRARAFSAPIKTEFWFCREIELRYIVILLLCFLSGRINGQQVLTCSIAAASADSSSSISLTDLRISSNHESSGISFSLTNIQAKPIVGILFILELQDVDGRTLSTVPVFTRDPKSFKSLDDTLEMWLSAYDSLKLTSGIVPAGAQLTIHSWSPYVLTTCPTSAKVHLLDLKMSNGDILREALPDWVADPVVVKADYIRPNFSHSDPIRLVATVRVDKNGESSIERTDATGQMRSWLEALLRKWKFAPKIEQGKATDGQIDILLRVDQDAPSYKDPYWFQADQVPRCAIVVRILDTSPNPQILQGGELVGLGTAP